MTTALAILAASLVLWAVEHWLGLRPFNERNPVAERFNIDKKRFETVHLIELRRGTKRMRIWATDVTEAMNEAAQNKFGPPYDTTIIKLVEAECEGR